MTEPTERHRELALEACRNWARDGALIHGEVARACAIACTEERERCAELAKGLLEKLVGPVEAGFVAMKIRGTP